MKYGIARMKGIDPHYYNTIAKINFLRPKGPSYS